MSNKLSKKQLDLLIERVLSENLTLDKFNDMFGYSLKPDEIEQPGLIDKVVSSRDVFNTLKPFDEDSSTFSLKDIKNLAADPSKITTNIQAYLISLVKKYQYRTADKTIIAQKIDFLKEEVKQSIAHVTPFAKFFAKAEKEQQEVSTAIMSLNSARAKTRAKQAFKKRFGLGNIPFEADGSPISLYTSKLLKRLIEKYYALSNVTRKASAPFEEIKGKKVYMGQIKSQPIHEMQKEIFYLTDEILKKRSFHEVTLSTNSELRTFIRNYEAHDVKLAEPAAGNYMDEYNLLKGSLNYRTQKGKSEMFKQYHDAAKVALEALEDAIKAQAGQQQTISGPEIRTQRSNIGLQEPKYITETINNLKLGDNIANRIKKITDISLKYYKASVNDPQSLDSLSQLQQSDLPKMLAEVSILDMFNTMSKEFDSGAGAYIFEYLLAVVNGGQVLGKEVTEAGQMGAVDFLAADGERGSAKYYSKGEGIEQSAKGFRDLYKKNGGERVDVRYVIGVKKQGVEQLSDPERTKKRRGTSDPSRLIAIEIYTPMVSYDVEDDIEKFYVDGQETNTNKEDKILISKVLPQSIGVLYMARVRTETFRNMIDEAFDNTGGTPQAVYNSFKQYFDSLRLAKESGKEYTQTGDVNAATAAHEAMNKSKEMLASLAEALYSHVFEGEKYTAKQNEQKSKKDLDKLIKEVILKRLLK